MTVRFVLSEYLNQAMAQAVYDKLEDGGVVAFRPSLKECEDELRSTLEDWIVVGLQLGHELPVVAGIDLNKRPTHEPMDAV